MPYPKKGNTTIRDVGDLTDGELDNHITSLTEKIDSLQQKYDQGMDGKSLNRTVASILSARWAKEIYVEEKWDRVLLRQPRRFRDDVAARLAKGKRKLERARKAEGSQGAA